MTKSVRFLRCFWRDEEGAAAAEYALLLAIIAAGLAVAAGALGTSIQNALNEATDCIENGTDGALCNAD